VRLAAPNETKESVTVPTIKDLIRCALNEGRTLRDLEHDSGYQVRFQTFQKYANIPPSQFPKKPETIAGMAQALRVSVATVVLAYAESLGVPLETEPSTFMTRLPSDIDQIDPEMQNAVIAVTRAAVKLARGPAIVDDRANKIEMGDSSDALGTWGRPGKKPRVLRDEDHDKRHKRGS
jgi:hypothetical protein